MKLLEQVKNGCYNNNYLPSNQIPTFKSKSKSIFDDKDLISVKKEALIPK